MASSGVPVDRIENCYALGPAGTFSEQAAITFCQWFAASGRAEPAIVPTRTIEEAIQRASAEPGAAAVVPIENSESGTVVVTQDELREAALAIRWEISVNVRYSLLSFGGIENVEQVYCHPVAQGQCTRFLRNRVPDAAINFVSSNAQAGEELISLTARRNAAAIVPTHYASIVGSKLAKNKINEVAVDIQNNRQNVTRFMIAMHRASNYTPDFSRARTSLVVTPKRDRPGLLSELLLALAKRSLNLTRIESRPARDKPWTYSFFLDIENNEQVSSALPELRAVGDEVTILGTYDLLPAASE
jgi:chorismate mutase/prephenate dehydratase